VLSTVRSSSGGSGEGGSGWRRFRRGRAGGWTGSGRGARVGGEGVVCGWNLGGVKWSLRIPARSTGGLRWRKEEEEETGEGRLCSGRLYRASMAQLMGESGRERESSHGPSPGRRAAPACPRVHGSRSAPAWQGKGRTAEAALAVEGVAGQRVGEGSGAGLHSGGLRSSDGEVCCIGGREHTGRRQATWPSGERSARGQEAAGQRPERHVHGCRGVRERQRRRTWPGSGGGMRRRRNKGGREGGR
jgi:hypothetical protein